MTERFDQPCKSGTSFQKSKDDRAPSLEPRNDACLQSAHPAPALRPLTKFPRRL
jgi:hypothetical protein